MAIVLGGGALWLLLGRRGSHPDFAWNPRGQHGGANPPPGSQIAPSQTKVVVLGDEAGADPPRTVESPEHAETTEEVAFYYNEIKAPPPPPPKTEGEKGGTADMNIGVGELQETGPPPVPYPNIAMPSEPDSATGPHNPEWVDRPPGDPGTTDDPGKASGRAADIKRPTDPKGGGGSNELTLDDSSGAAEEHPDDQGRVKPKFHWDQADSDGGSMDVKFEGKNVPQTDEPHAATMKDDPTTSAEPSTQYRETDFDFPSRGAESGAGDSASDGGKEVTVEDSSGGVEDVEPEHPDDVG